MNSIIKKSSYEITKYTLNLINSNNKIGITSLITLSTTGAYLFLPRNKYYNTSVYVLVSLLDYILFNFTEISLSSPIKFLILNFMLKESSLFINLMTLSVSTIIKLITLKDFYYKDTKSNQTENIVLLIILNILFSNLKFNNPLLSFLQIILTFISCLIYYTTLIIENESLGLSLNIDEHKRYSIANSLIFFYNKLVNKNLIYREIKEEKKIYINEINTKEQFVNYIENIFNKETFDRENYLGSTLLNKYIFKNDYNRIALSIKNASGNIWKYIESIFENNSINKKKVKDIIENRKQILIKEDFSEKSIKRVIFEIKFKIYDIEINIKDIKDY